MKKYIPPVLILLGFSLLILQSSGCKKDDEPEPEVIDSVRLDSSEVLLSIDVIKVLNNGNCLGCHSENVQQGGVNLEGYENLKKWAEAGKLVASIKHEPGAVPMPLDRDKLSEERIWIIERWVLQGLKDN